MKEPRRIWVTRDTDHQYCNVHFAPPNCHYSKSPKVKVWVSDSRMLTFLSQEFSRMVGEKPIPTDRALCFELREVNQ